MWIKFTKEAAANERVYHKDDTALFQDELGQKMVDGGFAVYYDPKDSLVLVDAPAAEGLEGENVAPKPVAVKDAVVVDSKGVAHGAKAEPKAETKAEIKADADAEAKAKAKAEAEAKAKAKAEAEAKAKAKADAEKASKK